MTIVAGALLGSLYAIAAAGAACAWKEEFPTGASLPMEWVTSIALGLLWPWFGALLLGHRIVKPKP